MEERVRSNNLGLKVRQRPNTEVWGLRIHVLVHDQGDKKPELGNLAGNRLDIYPVNAVLNQVEFAAIVAGVLLKDLIDLHKPVVGVPLCHRS